MRGLVAAMWEAFENIGASGGLRLRIFLWALVRIWGPYKGSMEVCSIRLIESEICGGFFWLAVDSPPIRSQKKGRLYLLGGPGYLELGLALHRGLITTVMERGTRTPTSK